jgi:hypothetical protein
MPIYLLSRKAISLPCLPFPTLFFMLLSRTSPTLLLIIKPTVINQFLMTPCVPRPQDVFVSKYDFFLLLVAWLSVAYFARAQAPSGFQTIQTGVEYAVFKIPSVRFDSKTNLIVVRIDPSKTKLKAVLASMQDGRKRTAREWAASENLSVVTNLGMFALEDHRTHDGYCKVGQHLNNSQWKKNFQSILFLNPQDPKLPVAQLADWDDPKTQELIKSYEIVVQNLRLIKGKSIGVWPKPKTRRWSEALLAEDSSGNILLIFSREPFTMFELNNQLLAMKELGIVKSMHLEGGPEASLSIHTKDLNIDLCGSYESGFWEDDSNLTQWPIPNVLGVSKP